MLAEGCVGLWVWSCLQSRILELLLVSKYLIISFWTDRMSNQTSSMRLPCCIKKLSLGKLGKEALKGPGFLYDFGIYIVFYLPVV